MSKFKRLLCFVIPFIIIFSSTGSYVVLAESSSSSEIIRFNDKNLEKAVRDVLSKPTGNILKSSAEQVGELDLSEREITDITPLKYFTGLRTLTLDSNQITDITALSALKNLEELYLNGNQIKDISSLTNLINLKKVHLDNNLITDVSPLGKLAGLEELSLAGNRVDNINAFGSPNGLKYLNLSSNRISDISSLSMLTNLTSLFIDNNLITDISPVKNMSKLSQLIASFNKIKDIGQLNGMPKLVMVSLSWNDISGDIAQLDNLPNIQILELDNNYIEGISSLKYMKNLVTLNIGFNRISDIKPLKELNKLENLDLTWNMIEDISALGGLTGIGNLSLSNNRIKSIDALSNLKMLGSLNISFNQITDIKALGSLTDLQELDLSGNQIKDISAIGSLEYLCSLDLTRNKVSDIKPLGKLSSINTLLLSDNNIQDISPLKKLVDISCLTLEGNKIKDYSAVKSFYDDISNKDFLLNTGITVNGKAVDLGDEIMYAGGVSSAPLRSLAETIGAEVQWDGSTRSITVSRDENELVFTLGSKDVIVNGKREKLPMSVEAFYEKSYVPIRFLVEKLGGKVEWEKPSQTVKITIQKQGLKTSKTVRVAFIGNSLTYTNSMPQMLEQIAKSKGKSLITDCSPIGDLKSCWETGIQRRFIEKGNWDYVSVQDYGGNPMFKTEEYSKYVSLLDAEIDAVGAKTLIYDTNFTRDTDGLPNPIFQAFSLRSALRIANETDSLIVPSGSAWLGVNQQDPNINLYMDVLHCSEIGAYLTACVFYASIFNESPEGASAKFTIGSGYEKMDFDLSSQPELVQLLQRTAWETVKKF
jgi:internalin A